MLSQTLFLFYCLACTYAIPTMPSNRRSGASELFHCSSNSSYIVKDNDDCIKIAETTGVSTLDLVAINAINGVNAMCTNLEIGMKICLPFPCTIYKVKAADTCLSIAGTHGLSASAFFNQNPGIHNSSCDNLMAETNVCVDQSGINSASTTNSPLSTSVPSNACPTQSPASASNISCSAYDSVRKGDICLEVASRNNITVTEFQHLNPNIDSGCTNLVIGSLYCVKSRSKSSESGNLPCGKTQVATEGDTCNKLVSENNIALSTFYVLNPSVDPQCTNLQVGQAYCVKEKC